MIQSGPEIDDAARISTGSAELDDILGRRLGCQPPVSVRRAAPGTGKTTLALQFLLEGVRAGRARLYITLSETEQELQLVAQAPWLVPGGRRHLRTRPAGNDARPGARAHRLPSRRARAERDDQARSSTASSELNPTRVVFDSLSEMRLLAQSPLRYRRQVLALKHFFASRQCTVILLDDLSSHAGRPAAPFDRHGVVLLEQLAIDYGAERRRLRVVKMRGIAVPRRLPRLHHRARRACASFPRLVAAEHHRTFIGELDPERQRRARPAARRRPGARDQRAADRRGRRRQVLAGADLRDRRRGARRARGVLRLRRGARHAGGAGANAGLAAAGSARCRPDPLSSRSIRPSCRPASSPPSSGTASERDDARVIVIDSLNGYLNAMPDERFLILQMHELLSYLGQQGVLTILVLAQHGLVGPMDTPLDISYLSDAVMMLRYFEAEWYGPACALGGEEAQRPPRAYHPRIPSQRPRDQRRSAARRISAASSRAHRSILEDGQLMPPETNDEA